LSDKKPFPVRRLTTLSVLTAAALALHVAESWFPAAIAGLPGVKLGLANSVTLLVMLLFGPRDALIVSLVRVSVGSLFGGGATGFAFSLAGALASWSAMAVMASVFRDRIHAVSVSVTGALAHNAGQLAVAVVLSGWYVMSYLTVLLLSAAVSGGFVGVCVHLVYRRLKAAPVRDFSQDGPR
jgi:heptaprenyl diphosphate synthase